jgi:signal peptidase I
MQIDLPRAAKKYSQSWEFTANRLHHGIVEILPNFLKLGENLPLAPLAAATLSLIPGLGSFFLTQKLKWPLLQFGIWFLLLLSLFFTLGTAWGALLAMVLFSFHQYLMYRCYLKGLQLNQIPFPGFWSGIRISMLMTAILALFYFAASRSFSDHFFYAQGSLGNVVQEGDRFFITTTEKYLPGQIVVFYRGYEYRHGSSGQAVLLERILAKEGDKVEFLDGKIMVNGQSLAADAGPLEAGLSLPPSELVIPKDCYFVLYPIQTNMSFHSDWFLIKNDEIKGKLDFKYFPRMESLP